MVSRKWFVWCMVSTLGIAQGALYGAAHPISKSPNQTMGPTTHRYAWQVTFDQSATPYRNDFAIRLDIPSVENTAGPLIVIPSCTLHRYGAPNLGTAKYSRKAANEGGAVPMKGTIQAATERGNGNNWAKIHLKLLLYGTYVDMSGQTVLVILRGQYYPGHKNKKHSQGDQNRRKDDSLTFTISEITLGAGGANTLDATMLSDPNRIHLFIALLLNVLLDSGGPCDDSPPADAAEESNTLMDDGELPYVEANAET